MNNKGESASLKVTKFLHLIVPPIYKREEGSSTFSPTTVQKSPVGDYVLFLSGKMELVPPDFLKRSRLFFQINYKLL